MFENIRNAFRLTAKPKVTVGPQIAEVLEIAVKVRTPVGEFILTEPMHGERLNPGDSITLTWTWRGFRTGT